MEVAQINKNLVTYYGEDGTGKPNFRVVWAPDQREVQCGEFEEYYGSIFVREFVGAKEVKKYPWVGDKWILEKLLPNPSPDVINIGSFYSYECVYVFQDKHQNWLPVEWPVCKIVINALISGQIMSPSDRESKELWEMKGEIDAYEEYLAQDGPSPLSEKRMMGQALFLNTPTGRP